MFQFALFLSYALVQALHLHEKNRVLSVLTRCCLVPAFRAERLPGSPFTHEQTEALQGVFQNSEPFLWSQQQLIQALQVSFEGWWNLLFSLNYLNEVWKGSLPHTEALALTAALPSGESFFSEQPFEGTVEILWTSCWYCSVCALTSPFLFVLRNMGFHHVYETV